MRARLRRLATALLALVLATAGLVAVSSSATAAENTGEYIDWGVKASFRNYIVNGAAHGSVELGGGVTENDDGSYRWPATETAYDPDSREVTLRTEGSVHFSGHGGTLDMTISDLEATIAPDGESSLVANVVSNKTDGTQIDYGRIDLATLDSTRGSRTVSDGLLEWSGIPATLSDEGAPAFGGYYGSSGGTPLDSVSIRLTGEWSAESSEEEWSDPGSQTLVQTGEVEAGVKPVHVVEDADRGTVTIIATGSSASTVCRAHNVGVYEDCLTATTRIPHSEQSLPTATVIDVATGEVKSQISLTPETETVNPSFMSYTTALNEATGEIFVHITNYGLVVIPPDAQSADDLQVLTGMSGSLNQTSLAFDQEGQRLFLSDRLQGLFTYTSVDGVWTQEHLLSELTGLAARYITVDQETGDLWAYDAGTSASMRSIYPIRGFREGAPAADRDAQIVLAEGKSAADLVAGIVTDPETGTIHAVVNGGTTTDNELVTVAGGEVTARTTLPSYVTDLSIDEDGRVYVLNYQTKLLQAYDGRSTDAGALTLLSEFSTGDSVASPTSVAGVDGKVYVTVSSTSSSYPVAITNANGMTVDEYLAQKAYRTANVYEWFTAPSFVSQPEDQTVTLVADEYHEDGSPANAGTAAATFTVEVDGDPAADVQWQTQTAFGWEDLAESDTYRGVTGTTLTVQASEDLAGSVYRAVARSTTTDAAGGEVEVGAVASDPATLTVDVVGTPVVTEHPSSVSVSAGQNAIFTVAAQGAPEPTVTWQQKKDGAWTDVVASGVFTIDGDRLTVTATPESLNGTVFRAKLSNDAGEAFSNEATLTVRGAQETTTYTGVVLEWTGSEEWQSQPPNGSAAHYFSAGASDGTQATYSVKSSGVEIIQRSSSGDKAASWSTRGAHVGVSGSSQVVRLTSGTATVEPDGSTVISWPASFSVNFYDGLVPFTMTDLVLTIDAAGTGTLTADLSGYEGDIADPFAPKKKVTPRSDVVVATFSNVSVDTENGFTIRPDYRGVSLSVPSGQTPQNTSVSGWGSWPQEFVDFHFTTGLAAYFYTTGGSLDSKKSPSAIAIGFDGAVPQVPVDNGNGTDNGSSNPGTKAPTLTPTVKDGSVEGSLVWGVKSSFRSYVTGSIAKGAISLSGGASSSGGAFRFGQTGTDWTSSFGTSTTSYGGSVRFTGHSGILDLTFSNPRVRIDSASSGTLIVTVNGSTVEMGRLNLAAASRSNVDGGVSYSNVPVTLTAAGARVFSYGSSQFYSAGEAMDSASFVIGANATGGAAAATTVAAHEETSWTAPAEPPANTGLYIDPDTLADIRPGTEITAVGEGFAPGETGIKVVLYSDPVVLETELTADENGRATWTGIIPLDTEPGEHTLTFQGSVNLGIVFEVKEQAEIDACTVTDATLDWGFKESFRSYISGTIAHGEWQAMDGATYETPEFSWAEGTGGFDVETFTGQVSFNGTIHFTGHDGLLDTSVSDPTLLFTGSETAYLLLDVTGLTMEDALAGNTENVLDFEQVSFVTIDLSSATVETSADGTVTTVTDAPTAITAQGYEAFPNYEAGTEFDPVSFTITTEADCAVAAVADEEETSDAVTELAVEDAGTDLTWLLWAGGAAALAGLIAAGVLLYVRRRGATGAIDETVTESAP